MLNLFFRFDENNTTVRTEILAGITTFLTMAYIIFVQPAILSGAMFGFSTGMDFGAVMVATCVSAAVATAIMALYARYPIAQAPGMGENFFFLFSVLPAAATLQVVQDGTTQAWQVALGVVFISGVLFLALSLTPIREMLVDAISSSMKNGIAVGIGLFIAFIGLQNSGLILKDPGTAVKLNTHLASPDILVFFTGLIATAALHARRVRGSIIWGIGIAALTAVVLRLALPALAPQLWHSEPMQQTRMATLFSLPSRSDPVWQWFVARPPSVRPTLMQMNIKVALLSWQMIPFIIIFLFMDVFDTIGTLIGVSEQAGFIKDNKLPRARQAMLSDAVGTVVGACAGTSTVTSFIESAAGVEQGGRTGLTSLVTAALFLLALFFSPLVRMIGSYASITAPALVVVGAMMIRNVLKIDWEDFSEAIPAFIVMIGIPLTYSIGDGLALGFISYPIIKFLSGKGREVRWLMYVLAAVLFFYFVFVRAHAG